MLLRDPHGLAVLFLVPVVFILIMSLALRDAFSADQQTMLKVQIQNEDGGALSIQFVEHLEQSASFSPGRDSPQLRVTLLPGFSELLATRFEFAGDYLAGEQEPSLIRIDYAASLPPQARFFARMGISQTLLAVQSEELLTAVLGYGDEETQAMQYLVDPHKLPMTESLFAGVSSRAIPSSAQHSTAAWLVFALFFSAIPLANSLVIERLEGSLLRMQLLDVPASQFLGAKVAAYYLVNLLQVGLMLAVGVWAVPLLGGDALQVPKAPVRLFALASCCSLAALGLALLVAVSVRSSTQATIAGGASTLILAAIGGILVPQFVMPVGMQTLASLSPMNWALIAFQDLLVTDASFEAIGMRCLWLAAFGIAGLLLSASIFRLSKHR